MNDLDEQEPGAASVGSVASAEAAENVEPEGRGPWLRFALLFGSLAIASEVLYYGVILESAAFGAYLTLLANVGGAFLRLFDGNVAVHATRISSGFFAVEIAQGCDAIQVCALLAAAVIAFPVKFKYKVRGLVAGIVTLQLLNMVRIVTLFWIGAYFPKAFQTSHEVVWPGILIVLTIVIWVTWVRWEDRISRSHQNEA